jgi:hypothetical protein
MLAGTNSGRRTAIIRRHKLSRQKSVVLTPIGEKVRPFIYFFILLVEESS